MRGVITDLLNSEGTKQSDKKRLTNLPIDGRISAHTFTWKVGQRSSENDLVSELLIFL